MPHIVLTYKCNLKCKYCFANEFVNNNSEEISLENFQYVLDFIKRNNTRHLGVIGGEPTIHSKFDTILDIIAKDKNIQTCTVYTNGLTLNRYIEKLKNDKFRLLINCNLQEDIGASLYTNLLENIDLYAKKKKKYKNNICLGINIYKIDYDYTFILEILKKYKFKCLRISLTIPNEENCTKNPNLNSFREKKELLFKLFKDLDKINVLPFYDCNNMPVCLLNEEEKEFLNNLKTKYKKEIENKTLDFNLLSSSLCRPVLDILPNLQVIRCFGTSEISKIDLKNFDNIRSIERFYTTKFDGLASNIPTFEECKSCNDFKLSKCTIGCLCYKSNKLINLRNHLEREY